MSEVPESLPRQRRFLIVMSVAVVAYYALGANLKTEAEYSGFVVNIGRPDHFVVGLWTVWGWALLRYWQQVFARWEPIRTLILAEVARRQARFTRSAAFRYVEKLAREGKFGPAWTKAHKCSSYMRQSSENTDSVWNDSATIFFVDVGDGGREYENLSTEIETLDAEGERARKHVGFSMRWTRWTARFVRARSWISAIWHLPAIGEHVAPFALAALAVASPFLFPAIVPPDALPCPAQ
jgi:hypothetical protein